MDRTFTLKEKIYCFDELHTKKPRMPFLRRRYAVMPVESSSPFVLMRRLIIPKQVNDKVWVSFPGKYDSLRVYADGIELSAGKDGLYEITPALTHGKTSVCAVFPGGTAEGFSVTVKRF